MVCHTDLQAAFLSFLFQMATVKLSLCVIKQRAIKTYGEVEVQVYKLLTSALEGRRYTSGYPFDWMLGGH
jgi:hypothetical protein